MLMTCEGKALTVRDARLRARMVGAVVSGLMVLLSAAPVLAASAKTVQPSSNLREQALPMADVKSYSYQSKLMDRTYDINVSVPHDYAKHPEKKYPALILTDGHHSFEIAHGIWRAISDDIDQPILISIGAPLPEGREGQTRRRVYEFSAPNWDMKDPFGQLIANDCKEDRLADPKKCVGGAPNFLAFITSELLPELLKSYRIDANDLGLFGHSAGGFFASWTMFQGDARFKRFIIGSPAMAYGDGEIFRIEEQYSQTHKDLPVSVYLASGTLELADPYLEGLGKIVSGHAHFGATLNARKYPGFKLYSEIHQDLGHIDVAPVVIARGLRLLYPKTPQPN